MPSDIGEAHIYRGSDGLSTRPDDPNTLTCQYPNTNDAPWDQGPLILGPVTIFFEKSTVDTFIHLRLTLSSLKILCRNRPQKIKMIVEENKIYVQNPSGGFFTVCRINVHELECFRCVCHELFSKFYLTFIPYS